MNTSIFPVSEEILLYVTIPRLLNKRTQTQTYTDPHPFSSRKLQSKYAWNIFERSNISLKSSAISQIIIVKCIERSAGASLAYHTRQSSNSSVPERSDSVDDETTGFQASCWQPRNQFRNGPGPFRNPRGSKASAASCDDSALPPPPRELPHEFVERKYRLLSLLVCSSVSVSVSLSLSSPPSPLVTWNDSKSDLHLTKPLCSRSTWPFFPWRAAVTREPTAT